MKAAGRSGRESKCRLTPKSILGVPRYSPLMFQKGVADFWNPLRRDGESFRPQHPCPLRPAAFIEPMECLAVPKVPDSSEWVYEIKLDGYRALELGQMVA